MMGIPWNGVASLVLEKIFGSIGEIDRKSCIFYLTARLLSLIVRLSWRLKFEVEGVCSSGG
jgi:hypothetical protein